jgi:hypothetical protein
LNCFSHQDQPAVAVCKNCGKAVCASCCDDTGQGIACSETCVTELQQHYLLEQRLKQSFGIGRKPPMPATVLTYAMFGVILLGVAVYLSYSRPGIDVLTFSMSAVFFVMAGASYKRYRDVCLTC